MPHCFTVPGFLSSELYYDSARTKLLWVDRTELVLGAVGHTRLARDGTSPQPPDGRELFVGLPLPEWWHDPVNQLGAQLIDAGYRMVPFGYDWRFDIWQSGHALAGAIHLLVSAEDPCTIVAHSAGGLVARAAWFALVQLGAGNLVRRIVTLGTPHQGSYAPVMLLSGDSAYTRDLLYWNNVVASGINGLIEQPTFVTWDAQDLGKLAATWPALYELFPVYGSPDSAGDRNRPELFAAGNWPAALEISQPWLSYARDEWDPWLLRPDTVPPPWILTTVGGSGYATSWGLVNPQVLGQPAAIGETAAGDGLVTTASALVEGSAQATMCCPHSSLFIQAVRSGDLARWILELRSPPSPPPPVEVVPGVTSELITDPPLAQTFNGYGWGSPCRDGRCPC